ncbi:MAG: LPXTG cell wall anchor domain-containing protein [Saccharofermentans sp.]|nr:LPXTG cell wall anchor domain-containing protein [Saccharofermentans sp.]
MEVWQKGVAVNVTLSSDKTEIAFETIENANSVLKNLRPGTYELKETVTPEQYLTADAIIFTLYPDGSKESAGDILVAGSPIVMIDQADPTYKPGGHKPDLPATGEQLSVVTVVGSLLVGLGAAAFVILAIRRKKNNKADAKQ